jgi:cold shock CspA family protein
MKIDGTGTVKNVSNMASRGFGFLISDDSGEDIFFHIKDEGNRDEVTECIVLDSTVKAQ